ncbi:hypothetical protein BDY24DRAFT_396396 [Mrakia frigida]|uniref:uncharacterized protein n=1 Tax=Mrakia frigida TaxID=29902 RepID=UPI003FCC15D2
MALPPLSFPLEILHLILEFAFLPSTPLYSLSPSLHPSRFSPLPLLLVSHSIRQICLPFFWRIVTLTRPQDWILLFHKDTGLLVQGEEGKRRWACVEELRIVVETAEVPVRRDLLMKDEDEDVLCRLRIPDSKQLPMLSFLTESPASHQNYNHNDVDAAGARRLERLNSLSPLGLASLKETLRTQHGTLSSTFLLGEVAIAIKLSVLLSRTAFFIYLLARTTPRTISSSLSLLRSLRLSRHLGSPLGYSSEYGNLAPTLVLIFDPQGLSEHGWTRAREGGGGATTTDHTMTTGEFSSFWTSQRTIKGMGVKLIGFDKVVAEDLKWWLKETREIRRGGADSRKGEGENEGRWEWVDPKGDSEEGKVIWE